jgi:hypothetical protein
MCSVVKQCVPVLVLVLVPTSTESVISHFLLVLFLNSLKPFSSSYSEKKPNLNKENFGRYRPVLPLVFLSKVTERVVRHRVMDYLSEN